MPLGRSDTRGWTGDAEAVKSIKRFRLTGVSTPFGGLQWERRDTDAQIAQRVVDLLGDRRLLWADFTQEITEHCTTSAIEVRNRLGTHLENPDIGQGLASDIRVLQGLFRDFVTEVGPAGDGFGRRVPSHGTDPLSQALGKLRALVGVRLGELAARYELEISAELASIVPDEHGWFFETFDPCTD